MIVLTLKRILTAVLAVFMLEALGACGAFADNGGGTGPAADAAAVPGGGKAMIVFFSWGGNTKRIAEEIQRQTGADLYEIKAVKPYPTTYRPTTEVAKEEQKVQARPEITGGPDDIGQYGVMLLGYPIWWSSIPMPVATFLEKHDFSGKKIVPFSSHGGGGLGQSVSAIEKLEPNAAIGQGFSVRSSGGPSLASDIAKWLKSNGVQTLQNGQ